MPVWGKGVSPFPQAIESRAKNSPAPRQVLVPAEQVLAEGSASFSRGLSIAANTHVCLSTVNASRACRPVGDKRRGRQTAIRFGKIRGTRFFKKSATPSATDAKLGPVGVSEKTRIFWRAEGPKNTRSSRCFFPCFRGCSLRLGLG